MRALRARAQIHSLRDHPNHDRPLNGGMWGGTRGAVPDMAKLVRGWSNRETYMGDLDFLNKKVWPRAEVSPMLAHMPCYTHMHMPCTCMLHAPWAPH